MRLSLRLFVLSCLLCLALPIAVANEKQDSNALSTQKELLQLKIDSNREIQQKDIESLKARIDAFDKRIDDQNNRVSDINSEVDRFAIATGLLGLLITVVFFLGGWAAYVSVANKAKEDAKSASKQWFDDNADKLMTQMLELERAAEQAHQTINDKVADVEQKRSAAIKNMQDSMYASVKDAPPISDEDTKALRSNEERLRHIPEASYSYEDWNQRAFAAYNASKLEDAALFWKRASEIPNTGADKAVQALFNRGVVLDQMKMLDEAIATYQTMIDTYTTSSTPNIRLLIAAAMHNKAIILKQNQPENAIAAYQQLIDTFVYDTTPKICKYVATAMHDMGIALTEMQRLDEAIVVYERLIDKYLVDSTPEISEVVGQAFGGKGFALLMKAKKNWANREEADSLLHAAKAALEEALKLCSDCGISRGNLAYVHWLLGDAAKAEVCFRIALASAQKGGEELYVATQGDFDQYPLPEDEGMRAMIDRLWKDYSLASSSV
ncbi:tetratricopeptide repeat protein [Deefgea piscis]|uniref:Tetratricopeptide repeat protein n=1 Tax=Deefgea piscis TaxID=2739061 RepID=A0A6M8SU96_9NEIS|nr:tetratricopeptide repeat protein [Deefgea piscis]QKJ67086.1 tetratricopeptide repeat protein [Deefgea piscis]